MGPNVEVFRTATQKFHVQYVAERQCNSAWFMSTVEYGFTSKKDNKQHDPAEDQTEDAR